jgi:hypothetical protein
MTRTLLRLNNILWQIAFRQYGSQLLQELVIFSFSIMPTAVSNIVVTNFIHYLLLLTLFWSPVCTMLKYTILDHSRSLNHKAIASWFFRRLHGYSITWVSTIYQKLFTKNHLQRIWTQAKVQNQYNYVN